MSLSQDVCLSVCLSHAGIVTKRIVKLISQFQFFYTKLYGNIPMGTPNWGNNRDFGLISRFGMMAEC